MPKVRWLGPALSDLAEIKDFYEEKEPGLGQRLIEEILGIERQLTDFPLIGRVSRNLQPEHRELVRSPHLIVYRVEPNAITGIKLAGSGLKASPRQ